MRSPISFISLEFSASYLTSGFETRLFNSFSLLTINSIFLDDVNWHNAVFLCASGWISWLTLHVLAVSAQSNKFTINNCVRRTADGFRVFPGNLSTWRLVTVQCLPPAEGTISFRCVFLRWYMIRFGNYLQFLVLRIKTLVFDFKYLCSSRKLEECIHAMCSK